MADPDASDIRGRLSSALGDAMRARDSNAVSALRSALSAIANAEAVPAQTGRTLKPKIGIGVGDVARRHLSAAELSRIVEEEIAELSRGAADYERLGRAEEAGALRAQAEILVRLLRGS